MLFENFLKLILYGIDNDSQKNWNSHDDIQRIQYLTGLSLIFLIICSLLSVHMTSPNLTKVTMEYLKALYLVLFFLHSILLL